MSAPDGLREILDDPVALMFERMARADLPTLPVDCDPSAASVRAMVERNRAWAVRQIEEIDATPTAV